MSQIDFKNLEANFQAWCQDRGDGLDRSEAFEIYCAEQILKSYNPADEDIEAGNLGGGDDGGIDAMYLYIDGQLMTDDSEVPKSPRDVDVHMLQAKHEPSFKETAVEKMESFARDLLSFSKTVEDIKYLNSTAKDAIRNFRGKHQQILGTVYSLRVTFHYACMAQEEPSGKSKVIQRSENLLSYVRGELGMAQVDFRPWAAPTLLKSLASNPPARVVIPSEATFSTSDKSTVCVVKLTDYAQKLLSGEDGHLQTRFLEPNVRDYNGKANPANKAIRDTLENPRENEDFWWLNNGITILADDCHTSGKDVVIDNPEIVNGLQTSHEVFNWYRTRPGISDQRNILLRILPSPDESARSRIIKATNSQTRVSAITLLSTEPIQGVIEDRLKLYGLFYDRKKGQCRRLRRPIKKVVGMKALTQAVIAIVLRQPDQARGRPESFIKKDTKNAERVFPRESDGDAYVACALLDRTVEQALRSKGLDTDVRRNLRYYVDLLLVGLLTGMIEPPREEISRSIAAVQGVNPEEVDSAIDSVKRVYDDLGATDKVAKGSDMTVGVIKALKDSISPGGLSN